MQIVNSFLCNNLLQQGRNRGHDSVDMEAKAGNIICGEHEKRFLLCLLTLGTPQGRGLVALSSSNRVLMKEMHEAKHVFLWFSLSIF